MSLKEKSTIMERIDETVDFLEYWHTIRKRRRLVILCVLAALTAAAIYLFTAVPVYRSTANILIERANPNLSLQEVLVMDPGGQDFYQTQYKILESRAIARDAADRLNLNRHPEYRPDEVKGFSPRKLLRDTIAAVTAQLPFLSSGHDPSDDGPDILVGTEQEADAGLVNAFQSNLSIKPVRNSRIVEVSFQSIDPRLAALGANTVVQAYIDWNLGLRLQSTRFATQFLEEQVQQARIKMEASEQAIQQYREKHGLSLAAGQTEGGRQTADISRQRLSQVNSQLMDATNRRIEAEVKHNKALELSRNPETAETIPEVAASPVMISLKNKEVELLRERTVKSNRFGPRHPEMVALNEEIQKLSELKKQEILNIVDSLKANLEVSLERERALTRALRESENETISRDKIAIQFQMLQQEAESNRQLYDILLRRLNESSVSEEVRTVNIYVVDRAEVPGFPAHPKKAKGMLIALAIGLGLGIGLAFFAEYIDDTINSPEELERQFGLPYLGSIPRFTAQAGDGNGALPVLQEPTSQAAEAYRGLRTGILFSTPDRSPRMVLVTSATATEGKTVTSTNIALVMALAGEKTLLVDLDMRRPRIHKNLDISNEQGISNVLVGDGDWRSFVQKTASPNLQVIPSGPLAPNPAELIASGRMKTLIQEWGQAYDRVIIDTSPITAVTDPVLLSRLVDGTVIIIKAGSTSRRIIAAGIRQIEDVQGRVLGAVLNDVDSRNGGYYYHYYQHYYYGEGKTKRKKSRKHAT
ncbi:MAG: polysaccharide biosynthesis tyrosine autokinase [Syntrophales bacterium]|jgi:capsular exopolysaccharide synthesis family protein|nr:polysaccharide biosynthesis tyrosine autokinase [Syntrophales bacterium]MDX9922802.1 polysaccharide biosynthesis tyrosine autokinase [Syntrophales bacterium]